MSLISLSVITGLIDTWRICTLYQCIGFMIEFGVTERSLRTLISLHIPGTIDQCINVDCK